MKRMALLAGLVLLAGCNEDIVINGAPDRTDRIEYTKDKRVDVCYAWSNADWSSATMSVVDCEKVELLIKE